MVLFLNWPNAIKIRADTDLKGLVAGGIDYNEKKKKKKTSYPQIFAIETSCLLFTTGEILALF